MLVLDDFLDSAHGALFNAVAASDAGFFVDYFAYAVYNFDAFLRASVDADATADALIIKNYWMRHENLFSLGLLEMLCRVEATNRLIPERENTIAPPICKNLAQFF